MDTNTRIELPGIGDVEKDQPFSVGTWIMPRYLDGEANNIPFGAIVSRSQGSRGWELFYNRGKLSFRLIHRWPENLILLETPEVVLNGNRWTPHLSPSTMARVAPRESGFTSTASFTRRR